MGHLLLLLLPLLTVTSATDDGELIFVNILYRHGARTPTNNYPTDPYDITTWNGVGWGQLLNKGKQQQYRLGKWLRQRYDGFLPTSYKETDIYVQSTDADRALMSAYLNLAGLYEPDTNNWSKDIKWQPIPVHIIPKRIDNSNPFFSPCPKYNKLFMDVRNFREIRQINDDNKLLFKYASKNSGLNIESVFDVINLYGVLIVEEENNLKLPSWTLPIYPQPIQNMTNLVFSLATYTPELTRLNSGNLVQDLLKRFNDKINGAITQKVWIFSGHDITLSSLMRALGIYNEIPPPYCSTLMIELRRKADDYFVLFKYMNSTNADIEPYTLQIPGCESLCTLTKLSELVAPIIPTDWEKECEL